MATKEELLRKYYEQHSDCYHPAFLDGRLSFVTDREDLVEAFKREARVAGYAPSVEVMNLLRFLPDKELDKLDVEGRFGFLVEPGIRRWSTKEMLEHYRVWYNSAALSSTRLRRVEALNDLKKNWTVQTAVIMSGYQPLWYPMSCYSDRFLHRFNKGFGYLESEYKGIIALPPVSLFSVTNKILTKKYSQRDFFVSADLLKTHSIKSLFEEAWREGGTTDENI